MAEAPRLAEHLAQRPVLSIGRRPRASLRRCRTARLSPPSSPRCLQEPVASRTRWTSSAAGPVNGNFRSESSYCAAPIDGTAAGAVLADIAETALGRPAPAVEADFARRHGHRRGGAFAVIGMGRLGSREMALASDLDLILTYASPPNAEASDGPQPLPVSGYYARLSQRLISAITAPTAEGSLYSVDMRLRPSGCGGADSLGLCRVYSIST